MKKKNLPLIAAVALPIVFLLILAAVLLVPSLHIKPQHDFVYVLWDKDRASSYDGTLYENFYEVENGRIVRKPTQIARRPEGSPAEQAFSGEAPKLYRYDVAADTSREVSFAEASALSLDPGPSSPDGYAVSYDYNNDGIFELFGSDDDAGYVIAKGRGSKNLTGIARPQDYYYGGNFTLIGWIK